MRNIYIYNNFKRSSHVIRPLDPLAFIQIYIHRPTYIHRHKHSYSNSLTICLCIYKLVHNHKYTLTTSDNHTYVTQVLICIHHRLFKSYVVFSIRNYNI